MSKKTSSKRLTSYWQGLKAKEKAALAESADTTTGYLRQVFMYGKSAGAGMALKLGEETGLGAAEFRPDFFSSKAA